MSEMIKKRLPQFITETAFSLKYLRVFVSKFQRNFLGLFPSAFNRFNRPILVVLQLNYFQAAQPGSSS